MRVRPFDEQVSPRCASPVLLCAVCRDRALLGVRCLQCTCTYRCRHVQHVQMRKDTSTTVSLAPAEPWAGSGPGQVTSQATRRALTCGSRADRPGTDASVSDARCCCCSLLLPARGRAFVRSFVPRVMEGGDTNCYLLIGGGGVLGPERCHGTEASRRPQRVDAGFLESRRPCRRSLLFAFLFFPPNRGRPEQVDGGRGR